MIAMITITQMVIFPIAPDIESAAANSIFIFSILFADRISGVCVVSYSTQLSA
jgi:hypothetical protein